MTRLRHRVPPRGSARPVVLVLVGGLLLHVVDQVLHFRAGSIPILVAAPIVAGLACRHVRPDTQIRELTVLLGWGFLGTGLAILAVYLHATSYQLPRAMTELEMVLYDLGMFLWFVTSLSGAYALGARITERYRYALVVPLAGPILQAGWGLVVVVVLELGGYG